MLETGRAHRDASTCLVTTTQHAYGMSVPLIGPEGPAVLSLDHPFHHFGS
jgi:hypothetical protein